MNEQPVPSGLIEQLCADEVHCIMQFLDVASLLALARASCRLHSDAATPLVWQHLPLQLRFGPNLTSHHREWIHRLDESRHHLSLSLSHRAVVLWWGTSSQVSVEESKSEMVDALCCIPRMTSLTIEDVILPLDEWERLLSSEALTGVQHLKLQYMTDYPIPYGGLANLDHMTNITALEMKFQPEKDDFRALSRLLQLRSLNFVDPWYENESPTLDAVVECANLTRLCISYPQLYGSRFREFFTSPNMCRLEVLTLYSFECGGGVSRREPAQPVPREDFHVAFRAMDRLEEIRLLDVHPLDLMLPALNVAPRISLVYIEAENLPREWFRRFPSPGALRTLLTSPSCCPFQIHISLECLYGVGSINDEYQDIEREFPRFTCEFVETEDF